MILTRENANEALCANDYTKEKEIVIPDGIRRIGKDAFCGCFNMTNITIPDSVKSIGSLAFYGCNSLTIHGKKGSRAETYAKEHGIKFEGR